MRNTKASGWILRNSLGMLMRAPRLDVIAPGIALAMVAVAMAGGVARAADDEEKEKGFLGRTLDSIKSSVRSTSIDDGRIEYRERSPLVVPPKLDLPPPDTVSKHTKAPNWPKDPDEGRKRASKKKEKPGIVDLVLNPFRPSSEVVGGSIADEPSGPPPPPRPDGQLAKTDPVYDQAGDLFKTGLSLGSVSLFGGSKAESAPFTGEPTRESLTQPPPGYQTPSPSYVYGIGKGALEPPKPQDNKPATTSEPFPSRN